MAPASSFSAFFLAAFFASLCLSCTKPAAESGLAGETQRPPVFSGGGDSFSRGSEAAGPADAAGALAPGGGAGDDGGLFPGLLSSVLSDAELPPDIASQISAAAAEGPFFILDLMAAVKGDPYLHFLVDKTHPLPQGYAPEDLAELAGPSYRTSRQLFLRRAAAEALETMAAAARAGGITLTVSSAYRSYQYQEEVYARNVRESGQEQADRESARPGFSQHQTGLAADFGSIDDSFAETAAGRWMAANAGRFGWSLSFPQGYEAVTGYRWESWHFRYVGADLVYFTDTYFGGIQQYALRFLYEWETAALASN